MNIAGPIVILLALLLALPNAALAASFTLTPAQPSIAAGQTININGSGFTRGEQVAIWATAPDQTVISGDFEFAEGEAGLIDIGFKVPDDALGGRWSLTAYGFISKTPVITTFDVQGRDPATATPQATVVPTSAAPGSEFAFAALGYREKEKASYWFTGPDGVIHDAYPEGESANSDGRVDLSWKAPADAVRGIWVLTIQGLKSGVARGIPFEIR
ncbi:MAG: hypothetical protein ABIV47_02790 [Roseiflexaceae bacterium]